jgi:hypothetical protein
LRFVFDFHTLRGMDANKIINGLGGTFKVARLIDAPASTVSSWRKSGRIPPYRLDLLKLRADAAGLAWPDAQA